ncbi:hypothetical protein Tco_0927977 [Tanacetum coccineum]
MFVMTTKARLKLPCAWNVPRRSYCAEVWVGCFERTVISGMTETKNAFGGRFMTISTKVPMAFFVTKNLIRGEKGNGHRMQLDVKKFHAIYKGITRKSGENDGDVLEAAKAEYSACNKGEKFAYKHGWRVLKKHPKWDATYHFDSEDHTKIFGPDARPRPPGKTRPQERQ